MPGVLGISDFFAVGANGEQAGEFFDLRERPSQLPVKKMTGVLRGSRVWIFSATAIPLPALPCLCPNNARTGFAGSRALCGLDASRRKPDEGSTRRRTHDAIR